MDPIIASGLITGVGNLFSSIFGNTWSDKSSKELMKYQDQLQQAAIDRQNAYNAPKAQMDRLREAQLNPNLVYGSGVDGNQSSAASAGIANARREVNNPLQDVGQTYLQSKQMEMEQIRLRNEAFESRERQLKLRAETLGQLLDNRFNSETLQTRVKQEAQRLANDVARESLIHQQTNNMLIQANVMVEEANAIAAKTNLTKQQALTEVVKRSLMRSNIYLNNSNVRLNNKKIQQISHIIDYIDSGKDLRDLEYDIKDLGFQSSKEFKQWLKDHPNVQLIDAILQRAEEHYKGVTGASEDWMKFVF